MELKDLKYNEECKCPLCGSELVNYGERDTDAGSMWYECECEECGATWQEVYNVQFAQVDEVRNAEGETVYSSFNPTN